MKAKRIFTGECEARVVEAIRRAESRTSGEIVPLVVEQAHNYSYLDFLGGMIGLSLGTLFLVWVLPACQYVRIFLVQALGFLAGFFAFRALPGLKRLFLARDRVDEEVFERALRAFRELELDRTRDRTGILILVCLLERRVQILSDSGINARVKPGTWEEVVEALLTRLRNKDLASGLCEAIERCGEILSREFPARTDDTNEIADRLHTA